MLLCNSTVFNRTIPEKKFRIRPTEEILEDIEIGGRQYGKGVEKIFLLDSNAMIIKTPELLRIVKKCHETFPGLKQVACYACCEDSLCHGSGEVQKLDKINVKIPPGVDNGTTLRVAADKTAGRLKEDVYVIISVQPHPIFHRQGSDVYLEKTVALVEAALGSKVEVPTLDGNALMKIPPGTQTDTLFRLRGSGMPHVKGHSYGDHYVRVIVRTPRNLTKRQTELLEEFQTIEREK